MKQFFAFIVLITLLCCAIFFLYKKNEALKIEISNSQANIKALLLENIALDSTSRILKLTIDQLEYSKDSISKHLIKTVKDNKKNKELITQLQYMLTTNFRVDTVRFKDTIFVKDTHIDTCITDNKWYFLNLKLDHPNSITIEPKFINEFTTIFSYKKETIDPPKKFFLCRLLQRKHYVTETIVVNNNPYSSVDTTRFIEIIKR